ncbi:Helicase [Macleaya cordata]|uniref:ATP-dependent RNA helicase n=1 Tax=Macleaya cordata TaxID=56857 RepID=A0A200QN45_MACCD|nr:Helicase [Macleaya cordata]
MSPSSSSFLSLKGSTTNTYLKLLCNLSFLRYMGGGPRTFPGGLNKWQWKRMHEKKAKEKEKKLLEQEKQLYQARIRSQIRAKLSGKSDDDHHQQSSSLNKESSPSDFSPMTAKDHVKALADRFMKEGAEDLWNENDGPLKSPPHTRPRFKDQSSVDLRNLISDGHNYLVDNLNKTSKSVIDPLQGHKHFYSVQAGRVFGQKCKFSRNESSSSDEEEESDKEVFDSKGKISTKKMMGRATLGEYDSKKMRRAPKTFIEEETDLSEKVRLIRDELKMRRNSSAEQGRQNEGESLLSEKRFDECSISPLTIKALTLAGYLRMTTVQEATLSVCLDAGKDALVKAKTGTGKTAAFLLPAIETVLKATSSGVDRRVPPILVLILCPTRELASQTAAEANVMLKHHDGIGVQTLIGGRRFKDDQKCLESDPCQIIVATPGRLLDHIENKSGFSVRLMGLKMLILDEADHLLDLGFRKDIEKIVDCVPRQRQSLLFSATIPKEVRRVSQLVLKREHVFVDTVGQGAVETHDKVKQSCLVAPHELHFQIVYQILKDHISQVVDYKVIVFCTTAMVTSLLYQLLRGMKMNVSEMHSRKPQVFRSRVSEEFRESMGSILVTSDVSARGMNYPDVTLVVQVGLPPDREQYIHRLGRTGREGKEGEGILLLAPWEEYFLDEIKDLPIEKSPLPLLNSDFKTKVEDAMGKIDSSVKEAAYHAWLGYYNSIRDIGRDKTTLVELANRFCESIQLQKPPALFRKTAWKMGLKDIPGIKIRK